MSTTGVEAKRWAEKVLEEHQELRILLSATDDFLEEPRPSVGKTGSHRWSAHLSQLLLDLHDKLFRHFRHEEGSGMFDQLRRQNPRAAGRIDKILKDHPKILAELRELMSSSLAYSQGVSPPDPRLRRRLKDLLEQLAQHEEQETDLIQRLTLNDIGVAD